MLTCSADAVQISLSSKPPFRFVRSDAILSVKQRVSERSFKPARSAFRSVSLVATNDLPQSSGVWGGTGQKFRLWAETTRAAPAPGGEIRELWEMVSDPPAAGRDDEIPSLVYSDGLKDGGAPVLFAEVPGDEGPPVIEVRFAEDEGGANARNWTETNVLIDFSGPAPRVLTSSLCAYNEGGGACTALDSEMMPRSTIECAWMPARADALCQEKQDSPPAHRSFYALSGQPPPLSNGEHPTVATAAAWLRERAPNAAAVVRGLGPITLVEPAVTASGSDWALIGSLNAFFIDRPGGARSLRADIKHLSDPSEDVPVGGRTEAPSPPWTLETARSFRSRALYQSESLTILEVVGAEPEGDHNIRMLFWVGVESKGTATILDAIEIATERRHYVGCGLWGGPTSVIKVEQVADPFTAQVRVQRANVENRDEGLRWVGDNDDEATADCLRSGQIQWVTGRGFQTRIATAVCKSPEQPQLVSIDAKGAITLHKFVYGPGL